VLSIGTGMVTFAGVNTYSGGTMVSNGVLQFNAANSLSGSSLLSVAANGAVALNFAGAQGSLGNFFNANTFGTIALTANSANDPLVDFQAVNFSSAWLGAVGVVNYAGVFTPFGTNYQLGGGGGVLNITNVLADDLITPAPRNVLIGGGGPLGVVTLLGTNTYSGITSIGRGTLRADDGVGLGAGNLSITGGVLEISTNFYRGIGNGNNQVQLNGYAGFSAYGGTGAVISLGNGSPLTWGVAGFTPTNLVLNSYTANTNITFVNALDLGGLNRTVSVLALTATINGDISNGTLTKDGSGTLMLTGNNGNRSNFIQGGTLKIGANNTLWTSSVLYFGHNTNAPDTFGTLDLSGFSQTLGGLVVQTTNFFSTNNIVIGANQQLTVLGNVLVGVGAASGPQTTGGFANLVMSGAGSFVVTNLGGVFRVNGDNISSNGLRALLDMSGLSTAVVNLGTGQFQVGDTANKPGGEGNDSSLLILASNTTITAGNLDVGPGNRSAGLQVMRLGSGTNIINVNTFNVGSPTANSPRDGGTVVFNTPTGTLTVRAADGIGRTTFNVGAAGSATGAAMTNTVDFTGHTVDLLLGMLTVGEQPRAGSFTNVFSFDTGVLDANGLRIGNRPASTGNAGAQFAGVMNIGGGVVNIGGSGIVMGTSYGLNVLGTNFATLNITGGTVTVGSNIVMLTQNSRSNAVISTLNLTGGSLTVLSNIITGATAAGGTTRVATINLDGSALLDMTGHAIGTNNGLVDVLNFNSGTLQNVAQINNGGVGFVKGGSGALTLAGSNAFSSSSVVTGGTLALTGFSTGFGALGVTGGSVNVTGTGFFNNVSMTAGALNIATGGVFVFSNSYLNGLGSTLNLNGGLFTNATSGDVLTNLGTVSGVGTLGMFVDNRPGGFLNAIGGLLGLTRGFTNAANYGALQAFGPGSILQVGQEFTNYGSIFTTNGGLVLAAGIINNSIIIINNSTATYNNIRNYGTITVTNGGSLTVHGIFTNGGSILVDASSSAQFDYTLTPYSTNWFLGTVRFAGDFVNQAVVAANNDFSGTLIFNGTSNPGAVVTQLFEVASQRLGAAEIASTNFFVGTFLAGDPATGSNGYVRLVDDYSNGWLGAPYSQVLAASNLLVTAGSTLDWNDRGGFAYNLGNSGTMLWTNAGSPAGLVVGMNVVNTFTNQGAMRIGNGTVVQFTNAFLNGLAGTVGLFNGGVLSNFATGGVLANAGTISGDGVVAAPVVNAVGGSIVATGGVLRLSGGVSNLGAIRLTNATSVFTAPSVDNFGAIQGFGTFDAVLSNTGGVTNDNSGRTLTFSQAVTNNLGGSIMVQNQGTLVFNAGLVDNGTLTLNSGTVTVSQLYVTNALGSVVNFSSGTLNSSGSTVGNGSLFRVGNGTSAANLHLVGGAHSFANGLFINTNASLTGTGAITGNISGAGIFAPGDSAGIITDDGNLTLLGGASMLMELGGTNSWLYDQFDLTGMFTFNGALNVSLLGGYTPVAGERFDLFDFGSASGAFTTMNLPVLAPTLYWDTSQLYITGEIAAEQAVGSAQTTILPAAAVGDGAQWRADSGAWQNSGVTISNLSVGNHTISFSSVAGWIAATNQTITVTGVQTVVTTGTYAKLSQMLTPTPSAVLTNTSVTFTWDSGTNITQNALWVGSTTNSYDIYAAVETNHSRTITVPATGGLIYVRLWSYGNGQWGSNDYSYTTPPSGKASMISPANGSTNTSTTVTYSWTAGTGVSQYAMWIGSSSNSYDLYAAALGTNQSQTVTSLPSDGRQLYVRLWSLISGAWQYNDYNYRAWVPVKARLTGLANNSTFGATNVTLTWDSGSVASQYALWVGTAPGTYDLYAQALGTNRSQALIMPSDGRRVYVGLWSLINGEWKRNNYEFTAFTTTAAAQMIAPTNGTTFSSSPVTFSWTSGTGVSQYAMWVGSAPGDYDLYALSLGTNQTQQLSLPIDGNAIYVRLWSLIGGTWDHVDYEYQTTYLSGKTKAAMTSPANGAALPAETTTFTWSAGVGVTQYALWAGTQPGSYDLYAAVEAGTSRALTLPKDGSPVYIRLWSMIDGAWKYTDYFYTTFYGP
jgi:autotransporter-associated beta strand protein